MICLLFITTELTLQSPSYLGHPPPRLLHIGRRPLRSATEGRAHRRGHRGRTARRGARRCDGGARTEGQWRCPGLEPRISRDSTRQRGQGWCRRAWQRQRRCCVRAAAAPAGVVQASVATAAAVLRSSCGGTQQRHIAREVVPPSSAIMLGRWCHPAAPYCSGCGAAPSIAAIAPAYALPAPVGSATHPSETAGTRSSTWSGGALAGCALAACALAGCALAGCALAGCALASCALAGWLPGCPSGAVCHTTGVSPSPLSPLPPLSPPSSLSPLSPLSPISGRVSSRNGGGGCNG